MSGITFGSVGDIIAVGQIVWALAQALSNSRGSAKEYQGLVKELQMFDQALLQVSNNTTSAGILANLFNFTIGDCFMAELRTVSGTR